MCVVCDEFSRAKAIVAAAKEASVREGATAVTADLEWLAEFLEEQHDGMINAAVEASGW